MRRRSAHGQVSREQPSSTTESSGPSVGKLVGLTPDGHLVLELPGLNRKVRARSTLPINRELRRAVVARKNALLMFEDGDPGKPIVVGVLQSGAHGPSPDDPVPMGRVVAPAMVIEADMDGQRVTLTANEEIVLKCGKASITLRRNGRVIVQGTQVDSVAEGTNRVRGGQVKVN